MVLTRALIFLLEPILITVESIQCFQKPYFNSKQREKPVAFPKFTKQFPTGRIELYKMLLNQFFLLCIEGKCGLLEMNSKLKTPRVLYQEPSSSKNIYRQCCRRTREDDSSSYSPPHTCCQALINKEDAQYMSDTSYRFSVGANLDYLP